MSGAEGGGGWEIFDSAKTGLVSLEVTRDGKIEKIELMVCSEETRPMFKEVAIRTVQITELIIRGNIHFFSRFRDPIFKPYHGF